MIREHELRVSKNVKKYTGNKTIAYSTYEKNPNVDMSQHDRIKYK